jgi:hypothetical protein
LWEDAQLCVTFVWLSTEQRLAGPEVERTQDEMENPVENAEGRRQFERSEYRSHDWIKIMLPRIV